MKILSSFKDYYDGVAAYGIDPENLLLRNYREIYDHVELDKLGTQFPCLEKIRRLISSPDISDLRSSDTIKYIFFCGTVYPVIASLESRDIPKDVFVTLDTFIEEVLKDKEKPTHARDRKLSNETHEYLAIDPTKLYRGDTTFCLANLRLLKDRLGKIQVPDDLFRYLETPYFFLQKYGNIKIFPKLGEIGLPRFVNPTEAFQQIAFFNANILTVPDNLPKTTGGDKVLIAAKGFDVVESFRTQAPGKKKENRKENRRRKKGQC